MQRCCANGIVLTLNAWACHADTLRVRAVEVACTVKFYFEWLWNALACRRGRDQCKKNTYYWVLVVDLCVRADLLRMRAYALRVDAD